MRGLKGTLRLCVVEREGHSDALVEVSLCLRVARSHLEGQRAQVVIQRHWAARGLHRLRLEGFGLGLREDQVLKQGRTSRHRWGAHIARLGEQRVVGLTAGGFDAAARHQVGRTDQAGGAGQRERQCGDGGQPGATRFGAEFVHVLLLLALVGASSDCEPGEQTPNAYCGLLWRCSSPQQARSCASCRPQSSRNDPGAQTTGFNIVVESILFHCAKAPGRAS